MEVKG